MKEMEMHGKDEKLSNPHIFDYNIVLIGFMGGGEKYCCQLYAQDVFHGNHRDGSGDRRAARNEYTGDF